MKAQLLPHCAQSAQGFLRGDSDGWHQNSSYWPLGAFRGQREIRILTPFPIGFPPKQAAQAQCKTLLPALLKMNYFLSLSSLLSLGSGCILIINYFGLTSSLHPNTNLCLSTLLFLSALPAVLQDGLKWKMQLYSTKNKLIFKLTQDSLGRWQK